MANIKGCIVIGCGGIGQLLIPPLVKLLRYHECGTTAITIIDGDIHEASNNTRQNGVIGENKATILSENLPPYVQVIPEYLNNKNIGHILGYRAFTSEPLLVIPAVDNMATRHLVLKTLDRDHVDYIWVCPGNSYDTITCSYYKSGTNELHPFERYNNLANPTDYLPDSCIAEYESAPQLLAANMLAAATTLMVVSNYLDNIDIPNTIFGELPTCRLGNS